MASPWRCVLASVPARFRIDSELCPFMERLPSDRQPLCAGVAHRLQRQTMDQNPEALKPYPKNLPLGAGQVLPALNGTSFRVPMLAYINIKSLAHGAALGCGAGAASAEREADGDVVPGAHVGRERGRPYRPPGQGGRLQGDHGHAQGRLRGAHEGHPGVRPVVLRASDIMATLKAASEGPMKGILGCALLFFVPLTSWPRSRPPPRGP